MVQKATFPLGWNRDWDWERVREKEREKGIRAASNTIRMRTHWGETTAVKCKVREIIIQVKKEISILSNKNRQKVHRNRTKTEKEKRKWEAFSFYYWETRAETKKLQYFDSFQLSSQTTNSRPVNKFAHFIPVCFSFKIRVSFFPLMSLTPPPFHFLSSLFTKPMSWTHSTT